MSQKVSGGFKAIIENHLKERAAADSLFAETLAKPNKNIDDCCTYILNEVQKTGQQGFADEEIFGMAVHYYDEDGIDVGKPNNGKVVVNHHVELSPVDKDAAHKAAMVLAIAAEEQRIAKKPVSKKPVTQSQPTLF